MSAASLIRMLALMYVCVVSTDSRRHVRRECVPILGWLAERIGVVDRNLARSGAHSVTHDGFQVLIAAVGLCKVGIVLRWTVEFRVRCAFP